MVQNDLDENSVLTRGKSIDFPIQLLNFSEDILDNHMADSRKNFKKSF